MRGFGISGNIRIVYDIAGTIDDAKVTRYHNNDPIAEVPAPCPAAPAPLAPAAHAPALPTEAPIEPLAPATEQDVRYKRTRFRFSMVGIPVGELI